MMNHDIMARAMMLLNIVEKVSTVAPGLTHISSEALAELRNIHESIRVQKAKEQGKPNVPAAVGDKDSPPVKTPPGMENDKSFDTHPIASRPVEKELTGDEAKQAEDERMKEVEKKNRAEALERQQGTQRPKAIPTSTFEADEKAQFDRQQAQANTDPTIVDRRF